MPKCIYCGEDAGWFKNAHRECAARAKDGAELIASLLDNESADGWSGESIAARANEIKAASKLTEDLFRSSVDQLLSKVSDKVLEDNLVSPEEERNIALLLQQWISTASQPVLSRVRSNVVKSITLSEVAEGKLPSRYDADGIGIIFRRGEAALWAFVGAKYYVYKKNRQFVSGNRGVSVRVAKGLYFRAGASRGRTIVTDDLTLQDQGTFIITNKAIHFKGQVDSFRMELAKIQSVQPYSDSIEISDTRQTSKPFCFSVDDPVFAANILMAALENTHA